ncbi:MAG: Mu transposase C-terminal domain-containing protein [Methylovulum sp.]|nr:Mu transposase C-terminal domain-containing protein [Methylovulum sp.]
MAIKLYCRGQKPCYTAVVAELQKLFIPPPTYNQVVRFFNKKFSQSEILKGRNTGQQLRALQYFKKRTADGMEPWDEVHADGWNTHFTAPHPVTGEYVTYELWDFHDVATRFIPPFSIGLTENTEVIAKGIENAIRFGGVMAILMTDSTKIVKNNVKFTGNPVLSIADMAGITITHPVIVGSGQTNGIAENFHSWIDKECRVLGTYQAKGMDSLTLRRTQKLTAKLVKAKANEDGQAVADISKDLAKTSKGLIFQTYQEAIDWLESIRIKWNAKPHSTLKKVRDGVSGKMRHQSPQEALDEWKANGWKPVEMDEESLVDLFRPRAKKFVRRGVVKPYGGADGPRFRHKELDHWEGKEVVVSYDIMDYRQVWVMDLQGALICEAPLDEACRYRAQTAADAAQETRALAQIRRLEKKIDTVEKRAGLDTAEVIDSTATRVLDYTIDAPAVTPKISMDELYAKVAEQEPEEPQQLTATETWLKYFSTDEDEAEKPVRREIDYGS